RGADGRIGHTGFVTATRAGASPRGGALVDKLVRAVPGFVGVATRSIAAVDGDLTVAQYRGLQALASGGENLGTLSTQLGVHPSTATRLFDSLVANGLVTRRTGSNDRREVLHRLTRRGRLIVV